MLRCGLLLNMVKHLKISTSDRKSRCWCWRIVRCSAVNSSTVEVPQAGSLGHDSVYLRRTRKQFFFLKFFMCLASLHFSTLDRTEWCKWWGVLKVRRPTIDASQANPLASTADTSLTNQVHLSETRSQADKAQTTYFRKSGCNSTGLPGSKK